LRSALAILAGYITLTLALLGLFALWSLIAAPGASLDPSWTFIAIAVAWGFSAAALGGYLAGKIAGRLPFEHAFALALATGLIGVVSMAVSFEEQPVGFQVANLVVLMSGCVAGGWLRRWRSEAP
jgi:hypothetical protein